ncbi:MAG: c-type cytochrome [Piscinibacter sp.]|uniref:c-type cytochrome n=1 Tax=Piscinibacter sp. TaxID=1903157 RepID=UPI001B6DFBFD|nr:c-type cytochrome [Piscinibacter sp.]MBP5989653.1 c-type cytochrome [Piscinibacter sp.]MBP6027921.1 c-type cytochrome [Piscinibacter sp.]
MRWLAMLLLLLSALTPVEAAETAAQRFASECSGCHGAEGVSTTPLVPSLAGQPSFYAITQLFLFRQGRRQNALMTAVAKDMSDAELRAFSDLIGRLPPRPPAEETTPDAAKQARGAALAQRLHCTGCHGADLAGGAQVPRLAGQREDYLLHALQGFRAATRVGYTAAMNETLAGTSPTDLEDLAHWLSHFTTPPR